MLIDEFLIALGLKVDNASINSAEALGDAIDDIETSADNADGALGRLYESTDGFVSGIEGVLGVLGFFTGTLGGFFAFFHGTIREIEDLIKEEKLLNDVTKEQLRLAKNYNESVDNLGKRYQSLKLELAFGFLPALQNIVNAFDNFLKVNKDVIVNGITGFLKAITAVISAIGNAIRFIGIIIEKTIGWDTALKVIGLALIYVNRAMLLAFATNPVFYLIAALAGLVILIDDFITYLDGGQSEFGDFWGAMLKYIEIITPTLQKLWDLLIYGVSYLIQGGIAVVRAFGGAFIDVIEAIAAVFALLVGIFTGDIELIKTAWNGLIENMLSAWNNLATLFEPLANLIYEILASVFNKARRYISNVIDSIVGVIKSFVSAVGAALSNAYNVVISPFKSAFDWIVNTFSKLPSLIGSIVSKLPGVNAISNIGSAVSAGANRIVNNYGGSTQATINVTAPNAVSAANQTAAALNNTQAQRNFGGQALA